MSGWLTELEMNVIKQSIMNENADKNDQNSSNDDDDDQNSGNDDDDDDDQNSGSDDDDGHGEATQNECENLVNVLQNNVSLSFENVKGISKEEKIMIKKHS